MPKIHLSRQHSLPTPTIKERLQALGHKLEEKYSAKSHWADDHTLKVKGTGVEGDLKLSEGKVDVHINIGMLLSPLKGKIEESLGHELDKLTKA